MLYLLSKPKTHSIAVGDGIQYRIRQEGSVGIYLRCNAGRMSIAGLMLLLRVGLRWRISRRRLGAGGSVNKLVQLATIQPDAAAIRTVIDFDALPIGHQKLHVLAYGTIHGNFV